MLFQILLGLITEEEEEDDDIFEWLSIPSRINPNLPFSNFALTVTFNSF
ncbi:hypothetical protein J5U23_01688 [Saccharolobus shibatae B12]|uniref:Uncharacterized protein n=1 Tax=Saccharolobus shibatae (strain ATCC 51178 / DSM 5389 / JCM 8931 / NBRC 15437 / B12) TaxID=523848 RepID=A0A8F5BNY5_SACSH|nr:hypothetical protein J5U23_01688 [Saccharolobus shibatae B12]